MLFSASLLFTNSFHFLLSSPLNAAIKARQQRSDSRYGPGINIHTPSPSLVSFCCDLRSTTRRQSGRQPSLCCSPSSDDCEQDLMAGVLLLDGN